MHALTTTTRRLLRHCRRSHRLKAGKVKKRIWKKQPTSVISLANFGSVPPSVPPPSWILEQIRRAVSHTLAPASFLSPQVLLSPRIAHNIHPTIWEAKRDRRRGKSRRRKKKPLPFFLPAFLFLRGRRRRGDDRAHGCPLSRSVGRSVGRSRGRSEDRRSIFEHWPYASVTRGRRKFVGRPSGYLRPVLSTSAHYEY